MSLSLRYRQTDYVDSLSFQIEVALRDCTVRLSLSACRLGLYGRVSNGVPEYFYLSLAYAASQIVLF